MDDRSWNCSLFDIATLALVVGVACAILSPGIQSASTNADRNRCDENLRTIGLGAWGFAESHNLLLPYNQLASPFGSWNLQLLPYIGQEKLAHDYHPGHDWWAAANSPNRDVAATRVATFQCPAAPHPQRNVLTIDPEVEGNSFRAAPTDYVGSAGAYYQDNQPENLHPGAMHHRTLLKRLRLPDILDGASQTILVVEMADKPNQWQAGKLVEQPDDKPQPTSLAGQWAAPNWNHLRSYKRDGVAPFGPCAVNCSNGASIYGFHPGGANVLMVDGSVRFLKAGLSQELLIALVSYAEGELLSPSEY